MDRLQLASLVEQMEVLHGEFFERLVSSGLVHAVPAYAAHASLLRLYPSICSSHLALDRDFTREWRLSRIHALSLRTVLEEIYGADVVERLANARK